MKTLQQFLNDLGLRESGGNYKAFNKYGYDGKYQMGEAALIDCGYCNEYCKAIATDVYGFCDTEKAMLKYLKNYINDNEHYLIEIGLTSIDYDNYHKQGPFINDYGKEVYEDYWDYVEDIDVTRDINDYWITFSVYRLIEN